MRASEQAGGSPAQPEKCVYCGKPADGGGYIINPGARHELPCCCPDCFERAEAFVARDKKFRIPFYLGLTALVAANLVLLGLQPDSRWAYLPMLGIGLLVAVFPYVFARYDRYQAIGLKRTNVIVRLAALGVAVFAAVLIAAY